MPASYLKQLLQPNTADSVKADVRDVWRIQVARDHELGSRALRVALAIDLYSNRRGESKMGNAALAECTGLDDRSIRRALALLVDRGHLRRDPGRGVAGRGGRTSMSAAVIHKGGATADTTGWKGGATDDQRGGHGGPQGGATVAPQTLLTHEPCADARACPRGAPAARDEKDAPTLQRELPMLADVSKAGPVAAHHLAEIRLRHGWARGQWRSVVPSDITTPVQPCPSSGSVEIVPPARSCEAGAFHNHPELATADPNTSATRASESAK